MDIAELFVMLGFKADTTNLKEFMGAVGELRLSSVMAALGVGELYLAMEKIAHMTTEATVNIRNFQMQTGQSTKVMQQWKMFAEQMGISGDDAVQTLKTLQDMMMNIRLGSPQGLKALFTLGIDYHGKTPDQILDAMHEKIKNMDPSLARWELRQAGISESLLNILRLDDEQYAKMKEIEVLSDKQAESWFKVYGVMVQIKQQIGMELMKIFTDLAPVVLFIENVFKAWLGVIHAIILALKTLFGMGMKGISDGINGIVQNANNMSLSPSSIGQNLGAKFGGAKTQNNTITFHVQGEHKTIIQQIEDAIRKVFRDADLQSESDNR